MRVEVHVLTHLVHVKNVIQPGEAVSEPECQHVVGKERCLLGMHRGEDIHHGKCSSAHQESLPHRVPT